MATVPSPKPVTQTAQGLAATTFSSVAWGLLPVYWHALSKVSPQNVLAYRFIFTMLTMVCVVVFGGGFRRTIQAIRNLWQNKKVALLACCAAVMIAVNWLLYIVLVSSGRAVEASAAYFVMPVINMLLAIIFLHERTNIFGWASIALSVVGVVVFITTSGTLPWMGMVMSLSFCCYGLLKRYVPLDATQSITFETSTILPFAVLWLFFQPNWGLPLNMDSVTTILLISTGIITALPLVTFAYGVQHSQYLTISFVQYVNPTLQLICAIWVLNEQVAPERLTAFIIIWIALGLYSTSLIYTYLTTLRRDSLTTLD